ncbi:MAG TPA: GGDEF domain-containing protein [bacterium]|nr:GGDEF domain-containing protein [bacterium]
MTDHGSDTLKTIPRSAAYALIGTVMGIGSPAGAILLRWAFGHEGHDLLPFFVQEWADHGFFFYYMLAGTCLAFGLFGYFLGKRTDLLLSRNITLSNEVLTDSLTGLGNHRFLHDVFKIEFRRHLATRQPISCIMMDLDHFKRINDTYGHPFGDYVLKHFAGLVRRSIRQGDTASRYGGEEFLCILPNCDMEEARAVAERIRKETENFPFLHNKRPVRVTVSAGTVTGYRRSGANYRNLIVLADQALYKAKHRGRNKVVQISLSGTKSRPRSK